MKLKYIVIIALVPFVVLCMTSCKKEQVGVCGFGTLPEYVVFGHFYGECGGEGCVEIYKVDNDKLYEDTLDMYPGSDAFYPGHFATQWSDEKFQLVKDLSNYFPEGLLSETKVVQGQPDAGDWGGIYFEIKRGSTHRFWLLDQMDDNMPAAYNEFVDKINDKIYIINH